MQFSLHSIAWQARHFVKTAQTDEDGYKKQTDKQRKDKDSPFYPCLCAVLFYAGWTGTTIHLWW